MPRVPEPQYAESCRGLLERNRVQHSQLRILVMRLQRLCVVLFLAGTMLHWTDALAQNTNKGITVDFRYFPGLATMDGNWAALKAGSDGKVYVGLACHGCNGHLVYYDSTKDRMVDVGDLTALSGESGLGLGPQSKIHAKLGEGKDGRIYFATHGG